MSSPSFEWRPIAFLRDRQPDAEPAAFALIVLNQPLKQTQVLDLLWQNAIVRVAADGGANRLLDLSRATQSQSQSTPYANLDAIIGDLDSLDPVARDFYTNLEKPAQIVHMPDQFSTDFGKSIRWIRSQHPNVDIVALGGLGGRVDQGLGQVHQLYLSQPGPGYDEGKMYLVSGQSLSFLLKPGRHSIKVREGGEDVFGKHVGIIPIGGTSYLTTKGLEWDVENWETKFGGHMSTSNHVLPETKVVEIETTDTVLFTIALAGIE